MFRKWVEVGEKKSRYLVSLCSVGINISRTYGSLPVYTVKYVPKSASPQNVHDSFLIIVQTDFDNST